MNILIVDCLAVGDGLRKFSRDFIGGGPKLIAGILKQSELENLNIKIERAEDLLSNESRDLYKHDLCLISAMSMDFKGVQKVIENWRQIKRNNLIIIGGPIATDNNILKKLDDNGRARRDNSIYSVNVLN